MSKEKKYLCKYVPLGEIDDQICGETDPLKFYSGYSRSRCISCVKKAKEDRKNIVKPDQRSIISLIEELTKRITKLEAIVSSRE